MKPCAREEAAERLASYGVAEPEEIDWWLAWAIRRRENVRDRLVDGLREVFSLARGHAKVAVARQTAQNAGEIGAHIARTLRRVAIPLEGSEDGRPTAPR
jgi:hypothetical protein